MKKTNISLNLKGTSHYSHAFPDTFDKTTNNEEEDEQIKHFSIPPPKIVECTSRAAHVCCIPQTHSDCPLFSWICYSLYLFQAYYITYPLRFLVVHR